MANNEVKRSEKELESLNAPPMSGTHGRLERQPLGVDVTPVTILSTHQRSIRSPVAVAEFDFSTQSQDKGCSPPQFWVHWSETNNGDDSQSVSSLSDCGTSMSVDGKMNCGDWTNAKQNRRGCRTTHQQHTPKVKCLMKGDIDDFVVCGFPVRAITLFGGNMPYLDD